MDTKLLFVCLGNICRSPAAEGIALAIAKNKFPQLQLMIDSAGTYAGHQGELPDVRMRNAAQRRGYKLESRSRPITVQDMDNFDMIIVMDNQNQENVLHLAVNDAQRSKIVKMTDYLSDIVASEVPDPYYQGEAGFEIVLNILEQACYNLLSELAKRE